MLSRNNMNRTQYIANRKYNDVKDCHHIQEYIAYARITILNYEGCAIYCYLEITQWECIIQWCSRLPQYIRINIDKIICTP